MAAVVPGLLRDPASGPAGRLLREHVAGQTPWLVLATVCMCLYAGATAGQAWLMEPMLDRVFLERDRAMLVVMPLAILALGLVKGGSGYTQTVAMARVGHRVIADLQRRLFGHLVSADLGHLIERGPGTLISRLTYDTQQLRLSVSTALTTVVRDLLTLLFLCAVMLHQDWRLACLGLLVFPLSLVSIVRVGRRVRRVARQGQAQMADLAGRLEQVFRGIRQVKADHRETDEGARTGQLIDRLFHLNLQTARASAVSSPMLEVVGGLGVAMVVFYGGWRVFAGETTPGGFFSFVAALLFAYRPLKTLANLHTQVQVGLAAADRIYAVLDQPARVRDRVGAVPLRTGAGEIRFDRVRFGYRPDRAALADLDLAIPAGKCVALVGPSGAGKSTVLNLILRFYDVDDGAVLIDGQDVRTVTLGSLRGAIALVSQEVDLFDDTVHANIAYGRPDADRQAVVAAARAAAAAEFVQALPQGYDTMIGPSGQSLSGGERQRLGIARAMLKDAPILLLDEATSALDSEVERAVQGALRRLMRGRTTVVIAHRLSTVVGADLIAVVDGRRVVETGRHADLLTRGGRYAHLHAQQFAAEHTADDDVMAPLLGIRSA